MFRKILLSLCLLCLCCQITYAKLPGEDFVKEHTQDESEFYLVNHGNLNTKTGNESLIYIDQEAIKYNKNLPQRPKNYDGCNTCSEGLGCTSMYCSPSVYEEFNKKYTPKPYIYVINPSTQERIYLK